jgi:RNA polymerase sigma factor (sigma-70 family)
MAMSEHEWLAEKFEKNRGHLRAVAYRMLGSASEADDAVQEAWLRLSRSSADQIENLGGWLTTVVARVCLDMLRSRKSRREESIDEGSGELPANRATSAVAPIAKGGARDPEQEAVLADSVGVALLVVLDRLAPAERLAFVLHDMFAMPFEEIAPLVGHTPTATRQLASRARRRVQGGPVAARGALAEQRKVAKAFLEALRAGDFKALVAVLDPDLVVRVDEAAAQSGGPREIRGAENWARGAVAFSRIARLLEPMVIDGAVGLVWAPRGRLLRALRLTMKNGKIVQAEVIADRARLRKLDLAVLGK